MKNKLSSKQLFTAQFNSDNHLISIDKNKKHKKETEQYEKLEKLIGKMSDELEKGKKKVDDLNFKKTKQFCFEDFRDSEILNDNNNNTIDEELYEDNKIKETNYNTYAERSSEDDDNDNDNDNDEDINSNNIMNDINNEDNYNNNINQNYENNNNEDYSRDIISEETRD